MWDLIVSVPDHCLSFYFVLSEMCKHTSKTGKLSKHQIKEVCPFVISVNAF